MRFLAWCFVVTAMACSGGGLPGMGGSSSSSSSGGVSTAGQAVQRYFEVTCANDERCASVRGRDFSSQAGCTAYWADMDTLYKAFWGKSFSAWYDEKYTVGDQARLTSCMNKAAAAACDDPMRDDPDCEGILVPRNPAANGAVCSGDNPLSAPVCAEASRCVPQSDNADCSTCQAKKTNGAACDHGDECTTGFCSAGASGGTCGPSAPKAKGAACTRTDECLGNLQCAGAAGAMTCVERGAASAACDTSGSGAHPPCMTDLACIANAATGTAGTCTAKLADGAICQRRKGSPVCRHFCVFPSSDAASGTCQDLSALPGAGSPCAGYVGYPLQCAQSETVYANFTFTSDFSDFSTCTCASKVASGGECTLASACAAGTCTGANLTTTPYTPGHCGPAAALNARCSTDSDCDSNRCTGTSPNKTCAAALTCP